MFTNVLVKTEKECQLKSDAPWSDTLHYADLIKKYWKIRSKGKLNRINVKNALEELQNKLPNPDDVWQGDKKRPMKNQLKRAADLLHNIRRHAWDHRTDYQIRMEYRHKTLGQKEKSEAVKKIRNAEAKTNCWIQCKMESKSRSKGVTYLLVRKEN
jgi:hypothetical protein